MTNTVEIRNDAQLIAALERFPERAERELRGVSDRALLAGVAFLKQYPPQRPGARYRRTRTLGRNWSASRPTFQRVAGGFIGTIGNAVPYAPWVQSAERQAWFHKSGGWRTDAQAIDEIVRPTAESEMEAAARRLSDLG